MKAAGKGRESLPGGIPSLDPMAWQRRAAIRGKHVPEIGDGSITFCASVR